MTADQKKENESPTMALAIAGSDPSGGAGVQADLKTFCAIGVHGGAAITSLTVQNTRGVFSTFPVNAEFVREQIAMVLGDLPVSHIKVGMVGTREIGVQISKALQKFSGEIICDPVLVSSSGHPLFEMDSLDVYKREVCARATVLTPNLDELALLSGRKFHDMEEKIAVGREILDQFQRMRVLIIKGGHGDEKNEVTDHMLIRGPSSAIDLVSESHPRIVSANTHGTGCTFASAFTAYHLLTGDYLISFRKTVSFMDTLLRKSAAFKMGHGKGPLLHHLM